MITARLRNPTVTLEAPTNKRQQECVSLRVNSPPPPKFLLGGEGTATRRLRRSRRKKLIVNIPLSLSLTKFPSFTTDYWYNSIKRLRYFDC